MITCCGLEALNQVKEISQTSAFTLLQMAKENGTRLFVFKVSQDKLTLVQRPAIFHANSPDHFVIIKDKEVMPELKYSGYVLAKKPMGTPVSYAEAKKIVGSGIVGAIGTIIFNAVGAVGTAIATVGSFVGGALGTAIGAIPGLSTVGAWVSGLQGLTVAGTMIGAGVGGAKGGVKGALLGGLMGGAGGSAAGLFGSGAQAAGGSIGSQLAGGFRSVASGGASAVGQPAGRVAGLPSNVPPVAGGTVTGMSTPAGISSVTVPGVQGAQKLAGGIAGSGNFGGQVNYATGEGIVGTGQSRFDLGNIAGGTAGPKGSLITRMNQAGKEAGLGMLAGQLQERPPVTLDVERTTNRLRDILGSDVGLPQATGAELVRLVDTPLEDLMKDFTFESDRTFSRINESFDKQVIDLKQRAASFGTSVQTSSDIQRQLGDIEKNRAESLEFAEQDVRNRALGDAIQAKQYGLSQSLAKNEFDSKLAFEIAQVIGQEEELKRSLENENFEAFQNIMAQILSAGFGTA